MSKTKIKPKEGVMARAKANELIELTVEETKKAYGEAVVQAYALKIFTIGVAVGAVVATVIDLSIRTYF